MSWEDIQRGGTKVTGDLGIGHTDTEESSRRAREKVRGNGQGVPGKQQRTLSHGIR